MSTNHQMAISATKLINAYDNSAPLDVHKWSDHPEVNEAVKHIFGEMQSKGYIGSRQFLDKLQKHLKIVLLDLYCNYVADPERYIGYHRNSNKYSSLRYQKLHINYRQLITVVKSLVGLGYVEDVPGFYDRRTGGKSRISRLRATVKLIELIRGSGVRLRHIITNPDTEVIILRDEDGNDIKYENTPETDAMREVVQAYNQRLQLCLIDFNEYDAGFEAKIDKYRKHVHRVFNGDWQHGGRFYGGWWHNIPREYRRYIQINGMSIDEFDFGYLHVALLYAREGIDYYELRTDPYGIDIGYGLEDGRSRDLVKSIFLYALNARNDTSCLRALYLELRNNPDRYPPYEEIQPKAKEILQQIKDRHKPIAHYFNTGIGLELQSIDSRIASKVIERMTNIEKQPVLCLHDSFLVNRTYTSIVEVIMEECYNEVLQELYNTEGFSSVGEHIKVKLSKAVYLVPRSSPNGGESIDMNVEKLLESANIPVRQRLNRYHNERNTLPFDV